MMSVGSYLREHREQRGVSLEELAQTTRIGRRFLEALESDDFVALPAGPFSKGFIRSYCQALNEPPDEALALYAKAVASDAPRIQTVPAPRHQHSSLAPVLVSLALLAILGAALGGLTMALRSGRGEGDAPRKDPAPAVSARGPSPSDRPAVSPRRGSDAPSPSASAPPAPPPSAPLLVPSRPSEAPSRPPD